MGFSRKSLKLKKMIQQWICKRIFQSPKPSPVHWWPLIIIAAFILSAIFRFFDVLEKNIFPTLEYIGENKLRSHISSVVPERMWRGRNLLKVVHQLSSRPACGKRQYCLKEKKLSSNLKPPADDPQLLYSLDSKFCFKKLFLLKMFLS